MASSNRHWPSMFKSKPTSCNTHHHHHQWRSHDHPSNNLLSSPNPNSACTHRSPLTTSGFEERSPEPKPRWNPKPEQIRILESIFNSGMVNPPRDEIRKIRAQLQEYGQVGDANVFYWFQNRKSRSKHKTRHLMKSPATTTTTTSAATTVISSSSSSEKSKSSVDLFLNSPTGSVNQQPEPYFQEPLFFTTLQPPTTQGFCFSELGNVFNPNQTVGSDNLLMMNSQQNGVLNNNINIKSNVENDKMMKVSTTFTPTSIVAPPDLTPTTTTVPSTDIQGVEETGKSTVFINEVAFEVAIGPFNVKEAFGDDAVLMNSYGQPVLTNECGVTLQPLQHGGFYYLVRSISFSYDHSKAIDLI